MPKDIAISDGTKKLLDLAQAISAELGWIQLSCIHIFLAYYKYTVGKSLIFSDEQFKDEFPLAPLFPTPLHFHTFSQQFKIAEPAVPQENIVVDFYCKHAFSYAKSIAIVMGSIQLEPHHVMLGILKCPNSDLKTKSINIQPIALSLKKYYELKNIIPKGSFGLIQKLRIEYLYHQMT